MWGNQENNEIKSKRYGKTTATCTKNTRWPNLLKKDWRPDITVFLTKIVPLIMLTSLAPSPMAKVTAFRLFLTNSTTNAYKTVKTSALDLTFPWNSFRDRFRTWTVARIAQFGKHHTAVMFRSVSEFKSIALFPHACIDRTLRPSIVPTSSSAKRKNDEKSGRRWV